MAIVLLVFLLLAGGTVGCDTGGDGACGHAASCLAWPHPPFARDHESPQVCFSRSPARLSFDPYNRDRSLSAIMCRCDKDAGR